MRVPGEVTRATKAPLLLVSVDAVSQLAAAYMYLKLYDERAGRLAAE